MAVRAEAMDRLIEVTGIVLSSSPVGDYDRRVVILTRERGKLHAFARGSRRPGSQLMAGIRPFSFGVFTLYEGQSALSIRQIAISNYFEEITSDMELVFLGSYFLEFADYYSRENGDEFATLKLLYQTLRALPKKSLDNRLVRLVYELRMMAMNGDLDGDCFSHLKGAARYALDFIITTPVEKLYTFALSEEALSQLAAAHGRNKKRYITRAFRSEEVLNGIISDKTC